MDNPYIRLHLKVNGEWRPFLRIPRTEFPRLTTRPLKWLRFLGWCIYGQTGELRTVVNGNQVQDDHTTGFLRTITMFRPVRATSSFSKRSRAAAEPSRFIDINILDTLTHSSYASERTNSFREEVIARDGCCIINEENTPERCQGCHIVPHSKGDEYIANLSHLRGGTITEIGDVRNGLLLYNGIHRAFGLGEIGFLLTPNRYLSTTDVPNFPHPASPNLPRLTVQQIVPLPGMDALAAPHNKDARLSGSNIGPSPYLLHFSYACAILKRWGQLDELGLSRANIQTAHYSNVEDESTSGASAAPEDSAEGGSAVEVAPRVMAAHPTTSRRQYSMGDMMDLVVSLHTREMNQDTVTRWLNDIPEVLSQL